MDFRARDRAPLTPEEWQSVDLAAQDSARARLVGRRILSIFGPLGVGTEHVEPSRLGTAHGASLWLSSSPASSPPGETAAPEPVTALRRPPLPLPLLFRDARLSFRDLERSRQVRAGLDLTVVAAAAAEVAAAEDALVFGGDRRLGIEGLVEGAGAAQPLANWSAPGDAYGQIARAVEHLAGAGHPGPYVLVLSPALFARLQQLTDLTGTLEGKAVERLLRGPVLPSSAVPGALLLDHSPVNVDLAVGLDLSVAYAGAESDGNHRLRVMETVVPRIKRPSALYRMDPAAPSPAGG